MEKVSSKHFLTGLTIIAIAIGVVIGLIYVFVTIMHAIHKELILLGLAAFFTMLFIIITANKIFSKKENKKFLISKPKIEKKEKDYLKVHLRRFSENPRYICVLNENQINWIKENHSGVIFFEGGKGRLTFEYVGSYSYKTSVEEIKCNI